MMNEQIRVQQLLMQKFLDIKAKNPSFSIRALALRLDMQPSATNEILKGERRVSRKIAERIANKLSLDPSERADLLRDFPEKLKRNTSSRRSRDEDLQALKLTSDQFGLISDWIHFAILSLIRVKDFKSDVAWIANRLNVTENEARKAISRLLHLNLIYVDELGVMSRTSSPVRTSDDVLDLSIQHMHMNDMDMAKVKLQELGVAQRDFTNFTFPANSKNMSRAKEIIRKAQDDLEELMDDENSQDVYRVCMYLFPLTKLESNNIN